MGRKKFHLPKPVKCKATGKTRFKDERSANKAMFRTWSHDSSMNIYNYHTYVCPSCKGWHFGNKKYYEKSIQNIVPAVPGPAPVATDHSGDGINPSSPM